MQERNDPAEYARARVEQIRKRLGHYPSQTQENFYQSTEPKSTGIKTASGDFYSKELNKESYSSYTKSDKTPLESSLNFLDFQNRIKNIDQINQRIKSVLKNQNKGKSGGMSKPQSKEKFTKFERKENVENSSPLKRVQKGPPRGSQNKKISKLSELGHCQYSVSIQLSQKQKQSKNSLNSTKNLANDVNDKKTMDRSSRRESEQKNNLLTRDYYRKIQERKAIASRQSELQKRIDGSYNKQSSKKKEQIYSDKKQLNRDLLKETTKAKINYEKEQSGRNQTIKLADCMSKQIKSDQALRQAKWEFGEFNSDGKWEELMKLCEKKRIKVKDVEQLKSKFSLCPEENNPFFELSSPVNSQCIHKLLDAYEKAQRNWQSEINECASIKKLENQNFGITDIDCSKKGYISLEDLVCFINLYTGSFYRNRDVFSLHRRFNKGENKTQLKYEQFLDKVTAKN